MNSWGNDTIGFNVVAKNTPENKEVLEGFMTFCHEEVQGNYTLGLKLLLSHYSFQNNFILLSERIAEIESRLDALEKKSKSMDSVF